MLGMAMAELKFPVTALENEKFQVVVDMSLYAKESLVSYANGKCLVSRSNLNRCLARIAFVSGSDFDDQNPDFRCR
jgi:hypothetical protein